MDVSKLTSPDLGLGGLKRTLPENDPPRPRKRNATACQICRARKTKCDNKKPRCSYCQSIGAACDDAIEQSVPSVLVPEGLKD